MGNNQELAKIFYLMADYFTMNDVAFKPQAYRKAAEVLESSEKDVKEIYEEGGVEELEKIPSVGRGIALKIEEFLKMGKIGEYEKMKKETPVDLEGLSAVAGLGPKKIKALYEKLKVKNLADLEKVAKAGKIGKLENFGEKSEQNILQGIEFLKKGQGRMLLGQAWGLAEKVKAKIGKLKGVKNVSEAGSLRRRKETIGDIDILVSINDSKDAKAAGDFFVSMPEVEKVIARGETKISVQTKDGFNMDLRIVPSESWGSALQYFTGSKEHNIATRKIAIEKGWKLNEYGIFSRIKNSELGIRNKIIDHKSKIINQNNKIKLEVGKSGEDKKEVNSSDNEEWEKVAGETEEGVYEKLGMKWIPPEMRENMGEIELALIPLGRDGQATKNKLPTIIDLKDIEGDLHCHSHWNLNHGAQIKEMVEKAMSLGYEYIGISDHTKTLHIEHGLNEKELVEQNEFIKEFNQQLTTNNRQRKFKIFHGCEANIMPDGSIDIDDEVLAKLDYVIAGVHSQMKMGKKEMTERVIKAMRNPNVDIISHPTGRILGRRDEFEIDFDAILQAAKETGTILEINAHPSRLDLKDTNIRKAKEMGVKMMINTDAHHPDQMELMKFGVSQARRGWAEKEDILNCLPAEKLVKCFKK